MYACVKWKECEAWTWHWSDLRGRAAFTVTVAVAVTALTEETTARWTQISNGVLVLSTTIVLGGRWTSAVRFTSTLSTSPMARAAVVSIGCFRFGLFVTSAQEVSKSHICPLGLPRVLEYSSTTGVVNYSSNFLLLEYSLISISGCKFRFLVALFCSQLTNCWNLINLCKLGALRFHLQHASLEIDLNIYI